MERAFSFQKKGTFPPGTKSGGGGGGGGALARNDPPSVPAASGLGKKQSEKLQKLVQNRAARACYYPFIL